MCAKKLRYPPPLDSDGPKVSKPKPGEKFDFGLKQAQDKPTKPKERPRTYKPRLAFYLLLGVTFMVMFEIIMVLGTGEDYRYSSIHRDKNDLEGTQKRPDFISDRNRPLFSKQFQEFAIPANQGGFRRDI